MFISASGQGGPFPVTHFDPRSSWLRLFMSIDCSTLKINSGCTVICSQPSSVVCARNRKTKQSCGFCNVCLCCSLETNKPSLNTFASYRRSCPTRWKMAATSKKVGTCCPTSSSIRRSSGKSLQISLSGWTGSRRAGRRIRRTCSTLRCIDRLQTCRTIARMTLAGISWWSSWPTDTTCRTWKISERTCRRVWRITTTEPFRPVVGIPESSKRIGISALSLLRIRYLLPVVVHIRCNPGMIRLFLQPGISLRPGISQIPRYSHQVSSFMFSISG